MQKKVPAARTSFHNCYHHGYLRAAVVAPEVRVADPVFNVSRTREMVQRAHDEHAGLVVFSRTGT